MATDDAATIVDPPRDATADAMLGRVLGDRYRLDAVLGSGGFAVVYRARHVALGRDVAVKVVQTDHELAETVIPRFEREAQALASLHHPGIVTVTDFGVTNGVPYLVMELVGGETLRDLLAQGQVDPARALGIIRQVLRALHYAHGKGVVHRDLKPENILVARLEDDQDHVQVLDFGFAKFLEHAERAGEPALTQKGTAFGTPSYIAPESLAEKPVDGRADVYSAGVILFEMLAGRAPFVGEPIEILRAHLGKEPPLLAAVVPTLKIAREIDPVVQEALAKDPEKRFASAASMINALDPIGAAIGVRVAPSRAPPPQSAIPTDVIHTGRGGRPHLPAKKRGFGAVIAIGLFLVGLGAVLVALTAGVIAWLGEGTREPQTRVNAVRANGPGTPEPAPAALPAPVDPWADPVPPPLVPLRALIEQRTRLDQDQMNVLFQQVRVNPTDCRPHLLLAYAYANVRWLGASIRRYERAFEADASCRGDERMQRELGEFSSNPTVGPQAARAYEQIYGAPPPGAAAPP